MAGWGKAKKKMARKPLITEQKTVKWERNGRTETEQRDQSLVSFIGIHMDQNPSLVIEGHDWLNCQNPSRHDSQLIIFLGRQLGSRQGIRLFVPSCWQTNSIASLGIGAVFEHIIIGHLGGWLFRIEKRSGTWLESVVAKVSTENSAVEACGDSVGRVDCKLKVDWQRGGNIA